MSLVNIKCPNCGASIQLDNSRESGFCSYCGSKVQIQEAINKIKIDRTGDIKNYLSIGQAAEEAGNGQEACDYANKILEIDPQNAEGWYLKMSGTGCMPGYNCQQMVAAGNKALEFCNSPEMKDRIYTSLLSISPLYLQDVYSDLSQDLGTIKSLCDSYKDLQMYDNIKQMLENDISVTIANNALSQIPAMRFTVPDEEIGKNEEFAEITVDIAKEWIACGLALNKRYNTYGTYISNEGLEYFQDILEKIKRGLPDNFLTQEISSEKLNLSQLSAPINPPKERVDNQPPKNEGCYIATAVYGSYEAPEVIILRHFRDNTLNKTYLGRWFIKTYYCVSPPIAKKLKNATAINKFVRLLLNKWVKHLEKH